MRGLSFLSLVLSLLCFCFTAEAKCPIEDMKIAASKNVEAMNLTKNLCEEVKLSDADTNEKFMGYRMTWGQNDEFSADVLPLSFEASEQDPTSGTLTYFKGGGHKVGDPQYHAQDRRICDPAPENTAGKKYVCPRQRKFFCIEGEVYVQDPELSSWLVKVTPLTPADFGQAFAKDNVVQPGVDAGVSTSCYFSGQMAPIHCVPWLKDLPQSTSATPAATPAGGGGEATPVAPE